MAWDLSGHGLLSGEAGALAPASLVEHVALAEELLDLAEERYADGGDKEATAKRALALQVNHQVAAVGSSARQSESRGGRSVSFRDAVTDLHPTAQRLATDLGAEPGGGSGEWPAFTSFRSGGR